MAATNNERDVVTALVNMGAERVEAVAPDQVAHLLSWREPSESPVERSTGGGGRLLVDGYDWHVKRSRLVEAWDSLGGARAIDWGSVVVGQIDSGYTEHPAPGWQNGQSPWLDTSRGGNFFYRELGKAR